MNKELEEIFVHTPNDLICAGVQKMILDAGILWMGGGSKVTKDRASMGYHNNTCIGVNEMGRMGFSPRDYWEEQDYKEISITELADILAKPTHTLMTGDEFDMKVGAGGFNEERALVLSIEKWERLLKEENWSELYTHPLQYISSDTCALCKFFEDSSSCDKCPLELDGGDCNWFDHPWHKAFEAVKIKDKDGFCCHGRRLLKIMRNALEELRKPKRTYKLGQWFVHDGGSLYELVVTEQGLGARTKVGLVGGRSGNRWSNSVDIEDTRTITDEEFKKIATPRDVKNFTPVEVVITVKKGMKK